MFVAFENFGFDCPCSILSRGTRNECEFTSRVYCEIGTIQGSEKGNKKSMMNKQQPIGKKLFTLDEISSQLCEYPSEYRRSDQEIPKQLSLLVHTSACHG